MYKLDMDLLNDKKYVFRVNDNNAEEFSVKFSACMGVPYEEIRRVVNHAIIWYVDGHACIKYKGTGKRGWFEEVGLNASTRSGLNAVDAMCLFIESPDEEIEASDMDIEVFM